MLQRGKGSQLRVHILHKLLEEATTLQGDARHRRKTKQNGFGFMSSQLNGCRPGFWLTRCSVGKLATQTSHEMMPWLTLSTHAYPTNADNGGRPVQY